MYFECVAPSQICAETIQNVEILETSGLRFVQYQRKQFSDVRILKRFNEMRNVQKGIQSAAAGCNVFIGFGFVGTVLNFHSTHRLGNPLTVCRIKTVSEYLHFFLTNFSHVYKCNAYCDAIYFLCELN